VAQIRDRLVAAHLSTDEEVDKHLHNVAAGILDLATSPLISPGPGSRRDAIGHPYDRAKALPPRPHPPLLPSSQVGTRHDCVSSTDRAGHPSGSQFRRSPVAMILSVLRYWVGTARSGREVPRLLERRQAVG
jgi:hypothetical protein